MSSYFYRGNHEIWPHFSTSVVLASKDSNVSEIWNKFNDGFVLTNFDLLCSSITEKTGLRFPLKMSQAMCWLSHPAHGPALKVYQKF